MRVRNVPASAPFLRTVITALVDGALIDGFRPRAQPERLAEATLYLPTRRAGRMAREIFLDVLDVDAVILPRIVTLGDIDEDELAFAQAASPPAETLELPPALDGLARRLALAHLIEAWAKQLKPGDPAQAPLVLGGPTSTLALADDLARLMDDMATRGVDWRALDGLVPDALDKYWQLTLDFLKIARHYWPAHLEEAGQSTGGAARPPDRGRSRTPRRPSCRAGDRGWLHRLDAVDRKTAACHREAAAGRRRAAGTRHRPRRGGVATDR